MGTNSACTIWRFKIPNLNNKIKGKTFNVPSPPHDAIIEPLDGAKRTRLALLSCAV